MILDDRDLEINHYSEVCTFCSNYLPGSETGVTCRAFSEKIPDEIWSGKNKHTEPYPGDHGIRFERIKKI